MSQFAIEKSIPVPPAGVGRTPKYPFREMDVGDSFLVPELGVRARGQVDAAIKYHTRRHGGQFTVRQVAEGVRVWRVA